VWLIMVGVALWRWRAMRARTRTTGSSGVSPRQSAWFWLGLVAFWAASDWPVGTLGAGYLAWVHMLQYMIYTLIAAPLILISIPEWRFRQMLANARLYRFFANLSKPLVAAVTANFILISTHAPWTVDTFRVTQVGSFSLDMIWFAGGIALWLPVASPLPEHRIGFPPLKGVYLFCAAGLAPLVPGGFLTFAGAPLYETYEIAPRVGLDALEDQQLAGAIMKVGGFPIVWSVIMVIWVKWATRERNNDTPIRRSRPTAVANTPGAGDAPETAPPDATHPSDTGSADP
jgi:putative membrane protein